MKVKQSNTLFISEFRAIYKELLIEDKDNSDIELMIATLADTKGHITLDSMLVVANALNTKSSPVFSVDYILNWIFNTCRKSVSLVEEVEEVETVEESNIVEAIQLENRTGSHAHITTTCCMSDCRYYSNNALYKCHGTTTCGHYESLINPVM